MSSVHNMAVIQRCSCHALSLYLLTFSYIVVFGTSWRWLVAADQFTSGGHSYLKFVVWCVFVGAECRLTGSQRASILLSIINSSSSLWSSLQTGRWQPSCFLLSVSRLSLEHLRRQPAQHRALHVTGPHHHRRSYSLRQYFIYTCHSVDCHKLSCRLLQISEVWAFR